MPLTADIYLQSPWIVVSGNGSGQNISFSEPGKFQVGTIVQVYMGSNWNVDAVVMFPLTDNQGKPVLQITDASGTYFLIDEDTIRYGEEVPT